MVVWIVAVACHAPGPFVDQLEQIIQVSVIFQIGLQVFFELCFGQHFAITWRCPDLFHRIAHDAAILLIFWQIIEMDR